MILILTVIVSLLPMIAIYMHFGAAMTVGAMALYGITGAMYISTKQFTMYPAYAAELGLAVLSCIALYHTTAWGFWIYTPLVVLNMSIRTVAMVNLTVLHFFPDFNLAKIIFKH